MGELINRMNQENVVRDKSSQRDKPEHSHHTEKKPRLKNAKVKERKILHMEGQGKSMQAVVSQDGSDLNIFSQMLEEHRIDPKSVDADNEKPLEFLADETRTGAARLIYDA